MTWALLLRLLALFGVIALGWVGARRDLLSGAAGLRSLGNAAFLLFVPALLFRTMARVDLAALPWRLLAAFFLPAIGWLLVVWAFQRRRLTHGGQALTLANAARPTTRAISVTFGNGVQMGLPFSAALFGEAGLRLQVAIVSVHALILLSVLTVLAEVDIARAQVRDSGARHSLLGTLASTVRQTVIHPVVLPVLVGLAWNLAGLTIPAVLDDTLQMLGQAVVPLCLVLIGASLAQHGLGPRWRLALGLALLKLFALPSLVLLVAHWGFGLGGLPLAVVVVAAAMPTGSNALLFAQRYHTLEAEATAVIVLSTLLFAVAVPVWLSVLGVFGSPY
ncbi:MAG TPA: AEC family transporter [Burkholderiaceae bacterium]|nr:AEC family transporter [Burkholderiaceae bacterium]HNB47308.1 AEC family transporter [Burkholderiaceae bacterium]